jgi:nucleoside-diphosphate-sugar epimerase
MSHRVLILGPSSGLAEEFVAAAPAEWTFEGVGRRSPVHTAARYAAVHLVDARELGPLEYAVRANACDTVVNFLQESDRERCLVERPAPGAIPGGVAWEVNVLASEAIGRAAVHEHKRVIAVSTDEVFPEGEGPAAASAAPLGWAENPSWYGGTWAEAESLLGRLRGSVAVLRVSALFGWLLEGDCDRRFASEMGRRDEGLPALLQPTFVPDAVDALHLLVENPVSGLFHAALPEPADRLELAAAVGAVRGASVPTAAPVRERHPGLRPSSRAGFAFRPTPLAEALAELGRAGPA